MTAIRDGELFGPAEPYMWNFFFGFDSPPVEDEIGSQPYQLGSMDPLLFTPLSGRHGNLGVSTMSSGQTIPIPTPVGRMTINADTFLGVLPAGPPLDNFASVGVISMLLERDWYSDVGSDAGYVQMRMLIQNQLKTMITSKADQPSGRPAFQPSDVKNALAPLIQAGVPGSVRAAVLGAQGLLRNVASLFNPDDLLGVEVFMWDMQQLSAGANIPFTGNYERRGLWQVQGRVTSV